VVMRANRCAVLVYLAIGLSCAGEALAQSRQAGTLVITVNDPSGAIVAGARAHLKNGGWLLLEHGYDQAGPVGDLLAAAGFSQLVSIPDLAGIPRVAGGKLD